jgi:hypothetical protein
VNFAHANVHSCKLLVATALAFSALTSASFAYTPEQQQRCQGDAMRLCGEFVPDVDRITACMIAKYSSQGGVRQPAYAIVGGGLRIKTVETAQHHAESLDPIPTFAPSRGSRLRTSESRDTS